MGKAHIFVTGATGLVGTRFCRVALEHGYDVTALVRKGSSRDSLAGLNLQFFEGDLSNPTGLTEALGEADYVVHAAAHIGDWGPAETYRAINVESLRTMLGIASQCERLRRWIHVSSLGVYPAQHHYGTDENAPTDLVGLDGYTRTKAEAELVVQEFVREKQFPAVILRPGFIYGPGERYAIPRVIKRLHAGQLKIIGRGDKVLNNTYVGNFTDAILLAIEAPDSVQGEIYNIRDGRLVTRTEYLHTISKFFGKPDPKHVPLWVAKCLAGPIESLAKLRGATEPPLLTGATMKFMTRNLDFSIEKAKRDLGYEPRVDFQEGMSETLEAFQTQQQPA